MRRQITVDTGTKYRQAIFIVIAVITLTFTAMLHFRESVWLIPALVSYVILSLLVYWSNKQVFLVPSQKVQN